MCVITDNDGDYENKIKKKYEGYWDKQHIRIFADDRDELNTLEPLFVDANNKDLEKLCIAIDLDYSK